MCSTSSACMQHGGSVAAGCSFVGGSRHIHTRRRIQQQIHSVQVVQPQRQDNDKGGPTQRRLVARRCMMRREGFSGRQTLRWKRSKVAA